MGTGGGPPVGTPLTAMEEKLIHFLGKVATVGHMSIPEGGMEMPDDFSSDESEVEEVVRTLEYLRVEN